MGLDVYVGSLTRYYARDWETIVQKHGRESGITVATVRVDHSAGAITDPETIRRVIIEWRKRLSEHLGGNISEPLCWDESPGSPYFTDKGVF